MKSDNFAIALKKFGTRARFRPFTVELNSGGRVEIRHPEALALVGDFAVHVGPNKEVTFLDHENVSRVYELPDLPGTGDGPEYAPAAAA